MKYIILDSLDFDGSPVKTVVAVRSDVRSSVAAGTVLHESAEDVAAILGVSPAVVKAMAGTTEQPTVVEEVSVDAPAAALSLLLARYELNHTYSDRLHAIKKAHAELGDSASTEGIFGTAYRLLSDVGTPVKTTK